MSGPIYPVILQQPFAYAGVKNTIPYASSSPNASWHDGFPPVTMEPYGAGGVPPAGQDFNGIYYELSAVLIWANCGGQFKFDSAFASAVGYPAGAVLSSNDWSHSFICLLDGTVTDPNTAINVDGLHWGLWSGNASLAGNYGQDSGAVNALVLACVPSVTTLYNGMRFAFRPANTNTLAATLNVGTGALPILRADALAVSGGDLVTGNLYEVIYDSTLGSFLLTTSVASQQGSPVGMVTPFAGSAAPTGWLVCDGAGYSTGTYPALFAVIGYTFGGAAGTFHVPNLQNNLPMGAGGLYALGTTGGSTTSVADHTHFVFNTDIQIDDGTGQPPINLSNTNYPNYYVQPGGGLHVESYHIGGTTTPATIGKSSGPQGATVAASNLPPYVALNYIIKT